MSSFALCAWRLGLLDDLGQLLVVDEQRLRRLLHLRGALVGGDLGAREPVVELGHRARHRLADGPVASGERLEPHANGFRAPLVRELGERRDGLHLDLVLRPLQQRQQVLDVLVSPTLPMARTTVGSDFGSAPCSISMKRGRALALPISASASTARSLTHQSLSRVASISCATARSSLVWLRISMAARRMSWFSSLMRRHAPHRPRAGRRSCRARPRRAFGPTSRCRR